MLGNSLTSANDLPGRLAAITGAEVAAHARGGARLAEQLNPQTRLGGRTAQALADGGWDHVVMQDMSNAALTSPGRFVEVVCELSSLVREAGATPVLYATWAYAPWCRRLERLRLTSGEMRDAMDAAHREACARSGALLADVCGAFSAHPDPSSLYADDGIHPSADGTGLAARVIASALSR